MAVLGLGLAALGRPGYMTLEHARDFPSVERDAMRAQTFAVLDAAWADGVRHFDTARSYGQAEDVLGEWLALAPRPGVVVSSKWGYRYTADWRRDAKVHEVKDHSLTHLEAQWPESRARLGSALQVYQVHSTTFESGVLEDRAVLERLATLKREGVAIGASVTGTRQPQLIDAVAAVTVNGARLFDWVQATWNVLEPSASEALTRARQRGLRTIAKEGLANGRLSARGDLKDWKALATARNTTPDALALAVACAQPFLDVVLSGAATVGQLQSNLQARAVDVKGLDVSAYAEPPERYWSDRASLKWS